MPPLSAMGGHVVGHFWSADQVRSAASVSAEFVGSHLGLLDLWMILLGAGWYWRRPRAELATLVM